MVERLSQFSEVLLSHLDKKKKIGAHNIDSRVFFVCLFYALKE